MLVRIKVTVTTYISQIQFIRRICTSGLCLFFSFVEETGRRKEKTYRHVYETFLPFRKLFPTHARVLLGQPECPCPHTDSHCKNASHTCCHHPRTDTACADLSCRSESSPWPVDFAIADRFYCCWSNQRCQQCNYNRLWIPLAENKYKILIRLFNTQKGQRSGSRSNLTEAVLVVIRFGCRLGSKICFWTHNAEHKQSDKDKIIHYSQSIKHFNR